MAALTRARIAGAMMAVVLLATHAAGQRPPAVATPNAARDLRGAIDIHVHGNPDSVARSADGLEMAKAAAERGMRAIVLKNHYDPTAGLAYLARKAARGLDVFGGVDLNLTVGGMNVHAVDYMAKMNGGFGRIVWMSTFDAENQVRVSNATRPFVRVSQNGELLPETKAVIASIARNNFVLATGHVSADEALMMFREGKRVGVRQMVATHGMASPTFLSVEQAKEATKLGAFIEFCGGTLVVAGAEARATLAAQQIRAIGPEFVIMSSDLGQGGAPMPTDGFAAFFEVLRQKGFSNDELDRMGKVNPATLLGLNK